LCERAVREELMLEHEIGDVVPEVLTCYLTKVPRFDADAVMTPRDAIVIAEFGG
jgi:hypothetical protein